MTLQHARDAPLPRFQGQEERGRVGGRLVRLCAAIVARLTFNGTIIETGTDSYRLASTRARAEESVKAS